jgi:ABC-2 type transport system ATP-binding protein
MSHLHALPAFIQFGGLRPQPGPAPANATTLAAPGALSAACEQPGPDAVVTTGLVVRRGGHTILHDISLRIARGSVTGLLGPSGCGKSTLIRAVMGVQMIAAGSVTVLGEPAGSPWLRPRVGYVTQAPALYDDLTVGENLHYFARLLDVAAERVDEVLALVDLELARDRFTRDLSGGQRARVSLGTALLGEPELLVLDEPTVGLDPVLRRSLWATFEELAARGTTLLVSSHVMDEAARCDELLLMRDGRLLATESPQRLRARTGRQDLEDAFHQVATEVA